MKTIICLKAKIKCLKLNFINTNDQFNYSTIIIKYKVNFNIKKLFEFIFATLMMIINLKKKKIRKKKN
jgi:hypothetical protein